ncbi:MAG: hypothetical protein KAT38_06920, partial [Bacteroidales bacterium]|nr:hypothetical protein [Bacteroidales bacterium]
MKSKINTQRHITPVLLCIIYVYLLAGFGNDIAGQRSDINTRKVMLDSAKQLSWPQNVHLLEENLELIPAPDKEVKIRYLSSIAFYYHRQALSEESGNTENLNRAKSYYRETLKLDSINTSARNNLVLLLISQGDLAEAGKHLDILISLDKKNEIKYRITKADINLAEKDSLKAFEEYRKILFLNPDDQAIMRQIITLFYDSMRWGSPSQLYDLATELKNYGYYSLAKPGYEKLMDIALSKKNLNQAYSFLTEWADMLSMKDNIFENDLSGLPCSSSSFTTVCNELSDLVSNPVEKLDQLTWWGQTSLRKHITGNIVLVVYHQQKDSISPRQRAFMLEELSQFIPEIYLYGQQELEQKYPVILEVFTQLALLYNSYPFLDTGFVKFRALESELFTGKGMYYASNNKEGIFRMHSVLGFIYFERGIWRSLERTQNAEFQLSRAIDVALGITEEDPSRYLPVPVLYFNLAQIYDSLGTKTKAVDFYLNAAADYLDVDDLLNALAVLDKAEPILSFSDLNKHKVLKDITLFRIDIEKLIGLPDVNNKRQLRKKIGEIPVNPDGSQNLPVHFTNRQYFKILADLGYNLSLSSQEKYIPVLEGMALEAISQEKALSSYDDLVRLKRVSNAFEINLYQKQPDDLIITMPEQKSIRETESEAKEWQINFGSYNQTVIVRIDNDLRDIGSIYNSFYLEQPTRFLNLLKDIKIKDGNYYVQPDFNNIKVLEEMEQTGLKQV